MGRLFAAQARHNLNHGARGRSEELVDLHCGELVRAARGGDGAAFAELVRPELAAMLRLAWSITHSETEAEDVLQEALTKLYRSLRRFDETRPLTPWFARIVTNTAHNARRKNERSRRRDDWIASADREQSGAPIEDEALRRTEADELRQAIFLLGPSDREIIGLRHLVGLTEREVAEALQIPTGTVKSRTARALVRLRSIVEASAEPSKTTDPKEHDV